MPPLQRTQSAFAVRGPISQTLRALQASPLVHVECQERISGLTRQVEELSQQLQDCTAPQDVLDTPRVYLALTPPGSSCPSPNKKGADYRKQLEITLVAAELKDELALLGSELKVMKRDEERQRRDGATVVAELEEAERNVEHQRHDLAQLRSKLDRMKCEQTLLVKTLEQTDTEYEQERRKWKNRCEKRARELNKESEVSHDLKKKLEGTQLHCQRLQTAQGDRLEQTRAELKKTLDELERKDQALNQTRAQLEDAKDETDVANKKREEAEQLLGYLKSEDDGTFGWLKEKFFGQKTEIVTKHLREVIERAMEGPSSKEHKGTALLAAQAFCAKWDIGDAGEILIILRREGGNRKRFLRAIKAKCPLSDAAVHRLDAALLHRTESYIRSQAGLVDQLADLMAAAKGITTHAKDIKGDVKALTGAGSAGSSAEHAGGGSSEGTNASAATERSATGSASNTSAS